MRSTLLKDATRSPSSRRRLPATIVAVLAMVATLVPALPAAAALPTGVRVDGVPATIAVGDVLTLRFTDTSASGVSEVTAAQLSLPAEWELLDVTSDDGTVLTNRFVNDGELDGGLNFPTDGVRGDRWDVSLEGGGSFTTAAGASLFTAEVRVGPTALDRRIEVVDVVAFGDGGSRNGFEFSTVVSTWDVRSPNVVSTGAVYPLAVTNRSNQPAEVSRIEIEVPDQSAVSVVSGPTPTSDLLENGNTRLTFDFPYVFPAAGASVLAGADALLLEVVTSTPSRADGNGAGEFIGVEVYASNGETEDLIHNETSAPFVEHSVRVSGTGTLEAGDIGNYSLVDARGTITNDGFPNSTMGTQQVQLLLPAGVSYVPGSASTGDASVATGSGTVTFAGPFTTNVGETLLTFQLTYDGSNPGEAQAIDVLSTPDDPRAPVYNSTLGTVGFTKLFDVDLLGPAPWVLAQGGFSAQGPESFIRVADDGTSGGPAIIEYDNRLSSGGGASIAPAIEATTTATSTGPVTLAFDFSGFHAYFLVNVLLEAFVEGAPGETQQLTDYDQQICCTTPSAGFSTAGEVTLSVTAGATYGFRITGSNGDSNSRLLGTLVIGEAEAPVVYDEPEVTLLAAARNVEAGAVDVLGRLVGEPSTSYGLEFAGALVDTVQCDVRVPVGVPVPVTTDAEGVVDFGATFVAADVASGALPDRLGVVAVTLIEALDVGDGVFEPRPVTRFDPSTEYAGSNCIYAGFGNDAWTSALEIPASDGPTVRTASDVIEQPGGARWYRFPVNPNGQATIDLTDLPDDYDLAVFTDIDQEYVELTTAEPEDALNRLGAEFAPSAFSPSAFSPSAFSPSAFSPSAFSPSAFSPSAFSPSVYAPSAFSPSAFSPSAFSPSAFSPSAFSPSAFSPSAFSDAGFSPSAFSPSAFSPSAFSPSAFSADGFAPSAFSPSAFSPSAFSPDAYASAQAQALITVSASPGTVNELAVVNTWNNDTEFYVRVTAKPGAADQTPFDLRVELEGTSCVDVSRKLPDLPAVQPLTGGPYGTVIVWDSGRQPGTPVEIGDLAAKLADLALPSVTDGVVVDLAGHPRVQAYQEQADENPQCVYAANLVAESIKDVIDTARPAVEHVVLVGGDSVVPFFRYPDTALLGPESDYVPPVRDNTRSQASLRQNYVLGQDQYGASTVLSLGGMQVPVPELAVGRLVETPSEIIGMIDQFLGQSVVVPDSTLVTGYDFMTDAAQTIQQDFIAGTTVVGGPDPTNDKLIAPANQAPGDPLAWTAGDLYDAWLQPALKHDVVYLAGHFSANSALAADYQTQLVTLDVGPSGVDLAGTVIFSNGCHSGYNIVDGDGEAGLTLELDWAQAMAQQRATFIGGTGYQYGDTELVEYSERLYANFARELRRGEGEVAVGKAMVRAKREYLASTPDPRGLHRKSLLIATVFGLPMTAVDMPGQRFVDDATPSGIAPAPVTSGPGAALGLGEGLVQLSSDPTTLDGDLDLVERGSTLDVLDAAGNKASTVDASYLTASDGSTAVQPNEPILPLVSNNVTVPGTSLRGVAFRGGTYTDTAGVIPLSSAAGTELRGVHVPFASETFFPMQVATVNYYDALPGGGDRTRLLTTPVQHRVDQVGAATATRRAYTNLDVELFYSNNVATTDDRTPALAAPPKIGGVRFSRIAGTDNVRVDVGVTGDPAAGIHRAWLTTTTGPDGSGVGEWVPVDLTRSPNDSRIWGAVLQNAAAAGAPAIEVVAHAVNGVGLVSTDDNFGRYYRTGGAGVPAPGDEPTPLSTTILTVSPPANAVVGSTIPVDVRLTDDAGNGIGGQPVLVTLGGGGATVVTDDTGRGTVQLPALAQPGPGVLISASFSGAQDLAASTATATTTVTKKVSQLQLQADGQGGVVVSLTSTSGVPLGEQSVRLEAADDGQRLSVITTPDGTVRVPAGRFTAASGPVTAEYRGNATATAAGPVTLDRDPAPTEWAIEIPATVVYGDPAEVVATLTSRVGAVRTVEVTISVDGVPQTLTTSSTGQVRLEIPAVTSDVGSVAVDVDYPGDAVRYGPAEAVASIQVVPAPTMLTLPVPADQPVAGIPIDVTARLASRGAELEGKSIIFRWADLTATVATDANGEATVEVVPPAGGELIITAEFGASVANPAFEANVASVTLDVDRQATSLLINSTPVEASADGIVSNLYARLTGAGGSPIAGEPVMITVSGGLSGPVVVEAVTDEWGRAQLGMVDLPAGTYNVAADYAGDETYTDSSNTGTLLIDARTSLESARAQLLAADLEQFDEHDQKKVEKAIEWLDEAVDHADWVDGRPTEDDVLKAVRKAAKALTKVDEPQAVALAEPVIDTLWQTSRQVAVDEIELAIQTGVKTKDIDKAQQYLADGDEELLLGRPDKAVHRWEKAFDKVVDDRRDRRERRDGE